MLYANEKEQDFNISGELNENLIELLGIIRGIMRFHKLEKEEMINLLKDDEVWKTITNNLKK